MNVPDYKEFDELRQTVSALVAEVDFQKSLMLAIAWLDRQQTMQVIDCSADTLRRLQLRGKIKCQYQGDRPFFCIYSVRAYLIEKEIERTAAQNRILSVMDEGSKRKIRSKQAVTTGPVTT